MKRKMLITVLCIGLLAWTIYHFVFNRVDTITPSKEKWEWVDSSVSKEANRYFWDHFHNGSYDSIGVILERLTSAYLDNPNDIQTIYHLGFAHFWAIAERQHLIPVPASIIDHAVLAQKYLGEAYQLNPRDARLLAFLSAAKLIVGDLSKDKKLMTDGYFNGLKSIRDWKDFGEFSLAYTLSQVPVSDPNFKKALHWMKKTTERCYCPDLESMPNECREIIGRKVDNPKQLGRDRIIPNSWVAPHNIEGYFMSYGDLLVKSGDWEQALRIYELAKASPDYESWPYKDVLVKRMARAEQNVSIFQQQHKNNAVLGIDDAIMIQTSISCRSCHQMSATDRNLTYHGFDQDLYLDKDFYFLE